MMELREFISTLEKCGYLRKINNTVNWKFEIGEIARQNHTQPLLFENIADYPGCRLFTGGFSRIDYLGINLRLKMPVNRMSILAHIRHGLKNPMEPLYVQDCPDCLYKDADEVNLYRLPVPWWNPLDGGRYIGTWHLNITKDPFTGKRNAGVYRMQILSKNQATVSVSEKSHLAMHMENAERQGKDLEMAVAIGVDEVLVLTAASSVPFGYDEYSFAGALRGEGVKLRQCKVVDLEVPFEAEYVLEGKIKCGIRVKDGPYFDYAGKPGINPAALLFEVSSISSRADAIFRGMAAGRAGAEDHQLFYILSALNLLDFHGSALRQRIQNFFLRHRMYSLFQLSGRLGAMVKSIKRELGEK